MGSENPGDPGFYNHCSSDGAELDLAERAQIERSALVRVSDEKEKLRQILLSLDEEYLDLRGRLRELNGRVSTQELQELMKEIKRLNELMKITR